MGLNQKEIHMEQKSKYEIEIENFRNIEKMVWRTPYHLFCKIETRRFLYSCCLNKGKTTQRKRKKLYSIVI